MARFKIDIEIPLLLSAFGGILSAVVFSNFIIYRTCYVDLGYNQTECAMLGNVNNNVTKHLESLVEPTVTDMNTVKSTVESVITIIVYLFIGPWSDKFGRKPVMVATAIGSVISTILIFASSCFNNISAWYIIFLSLPAIIAGGGYASLTIIISYITDKTSEENRGLRFALLDCIFSIANIAGNASSSHLFNAIGYPGVFAVTIICNILSITYVLVFLPESLDHTEREGAVREFFKASNIKEMVDVTFKKRNHYEREIILLLFGYSAISSLMMGEQGLTYLFLREKFGWTLTKYTTYNSVISAISIVGGFLSIYVLHKLLSVTESVLIMMGVLNGLNGSLLQGLATKDYHIYIAGVVKCLGGIVFPLHRTLLSKLIPLNETGKLFALMMIFNLVFGLGAAPMYNLLYKNTLNTNPATYNFLTAGFQLMGVFIFMIIMVLQFLSLTKYDKLDDSTETSEGENVSENALST